MMRRFLGVLALVALVVAVENVRAAPLDAATCGMLKGEQAQLEQGGARANMTKGPDWAKGNLAADKLEQIKRLLFVDEQLLFRCSGRTLVELPPEPDPDPAAKPPGDTEAGQDETGKEAPKDKAQPATKDKAAAPPASKKAAVSPKSDTGPAKAAPAKKDAPGKDSAPPRAADKAAAPKPKPKPKPDDAFKPASPDPKVNPFANQPRQ
jgi:hypothetical protein